MSPAEMDDPQELRKALLSKVQENLGIAFVERISCACDLAERAHRGQVRDEGTPYVTHPLRVALTVATDLQSMETHADLVQPSMRRDLIVIGLLHDVLEDSPTALHEDEWAALGNTVYDAVRQLTRIKGTSKSAYLRHLAQAPLHVKLVKLADRLDNLRSISRSPEVGKRAKMLSETQSDILPWALTSESALVRAYATEIQHVSHSLGCERGCGP